MRKLIPKSERFILPLSEKPALVGSKWIYCSATKVYIQRNRLADTTHRKGSIQYIIFILQLYKLFTLLPGSVSSPTCSEMNFLSIKMQEHDSQYKGHRDSYTELNEVYFWTITINKWQQLLEADENKMVIIDSLQGLVQKELVKIYGYLILPDHKHHMWEQLRLNGKEFPKNSFEEFTIKSLVNNMKAINDSVLIKYA